MPDPFDPHEFDTPTPAADPPDYRTLLDAMRQAGTDGVTQQATTLARAIEQDATRRETWAAQVRDGLSEIRRATADLDRAARRLDMLVLMRVILGGFALLFAVILYQWIREPKIEVRPYGCSAGWDAKKGVCKGKWVPLQFEQP